MQTSVLFYKSPLQAQITLLCKNTELHIYCKELHYNSNIKTSQIMIKYNQYAEA